MRPGLLVLPLSAERKGTDRVWANDREVADDDDLLAEARAMSALGTGVTGGDPLLALDRVVRDCRLLKAAFGPDHQVHLYTGRAPADDELGPRRPRGRGIRFHPPHEDWGRILETPYPDAIRSARALGFAAGVEVPSLPGLEGLRPLLPLVDFFNVNELEWGEASADGMRARGLVLAETLGNAVAGARDWAAPLLGDEKVRYCSSAFKDAVQFRERMIRIAVNTARPFDEVTEDGTVVYGLLRPTDGVDGAVGELGLGDGEYAVVDGAVELAWERLAAARSAVGGEKTIIERYPNRGMVVEVIPL